jgi:hypothetical protein
MFMAPERDSVTPSSDRYDVINDCIPSSGPPPLRMIVSSLVAKTQPWYPTPKSTDPSVVMIIYNGLSRSNGGGVGSAGMSPVSRWMCLGRARNESAMPEV